MAFSEKAMAAIRNSAVTCQGCSCEPDYLAVQFTISEPRRVTGYECACGTVVNRGIYMGNAASLTGE